MEPREIADYRQHGYVMLRDRLDLSTIRSAKDDVLSEVTCEWSGRVLEADGSTVRSLYGSHTRRKFLNMLASYEPIVAAAEEILESEVYIYQFKVNLKAARTGDRWDWHRDLPYWSKGDGVRSDRLVNAAVFLESVGQENGPMLLLSGSHLADVVSRSSAQIAGLEGERRDDVVTDWRRDVGVLDDAISEADLGELLATYELETATGPAGSVLLFHPNTLHRSGPNLSKRGRMITFITYNSVENLPQNPKRRPWFLCARDYRPVRLWGKAQMAPGAKCGGDSDI